MRTSTKANILRAAAVIVIALVLLAIFRGRTWFASSIKPVSTQKPEQTNAIAAKRVLYWYDPMHPSYRSDRPGTAPDCGMALVPMYENEGTADGNTIHISQQRQKTLGVKLVSVEERGLLSELKATGSVAADDRRISHVHVHVPGWVEEVYGIYADGYVAKGQPLFSIYSPEMVTAEREYLIALDGVKRLGASPYPETARGANETLDAARHRLQSYDLSESQIRQLGEKGEITHAYIVRSPSSGFVQERKVFPKTFIDGSTDTLTIIDLSQLWVIANIYESELPYARVGLSVSVRLSFLSNRVFNGRIASILPGVDPQTHTAKVRIDISNTDGQLKPGMFAEVQMHLNHGRHLVIPEESILDTGNHQVVYVAREDGGLEAREINIGETVNGYTIVEFGLEKGEKVAAEGTFLLDSESRMRLSAKSHGEAHD